MKKLIRNKYFLTTLLCIIIYLMYLFIMKIFPFGENSILKCDLYQQYVNFFCYLRDVIINNKSIMVSWNLGLANNFFTTFAYYLASPLNLIVVFFNPTNMDIGIEILTLIKILLIANSAVFYYTKSYKYNKKDVILFGIIYAYCSYVICYSFHIMWLDCLYILPITLYFIDKYIDNGKIYPIIICLAYGLWTNYYIGFIVAFFAGIYFITKYYIKNNIFEREGIKKFGKKLVIFLIAIALAFGIIMVLFIPSIKQLSGNMSASNIKLIDINYDKIRLFINVIFNNYVYMFTQKSCMMFSSTIVIALLPMYYLNKNIIKKEKIAFSCIIVFMLLPIISPFLNKVWHGFTEPNCFYYRYSFTLIFSTIIMAFREYQNIEYSKKKHYIISVLFFTILTIIEIVLNMQGYLESDGYKVTYSGIIISCIIYLLLIMILYLLNNVKNNKIKTILKIVLFILIIIDLLIGAKNGQNNNDKYFKNETFSQYDSIMEKVNSKLENAETERIVFIPDSYGSNMSMKYGYSNIGYFTSARNIKTIKAMYKLGYNIQRADGLWITSYSGTFFNYDLAGVKYYITKQKLENNEIYGFELEEEIDGYYIYNNNNKFNIGFYLKDNISAKEENPFEIQNEYLNNLISNEIEDKYFEPVEKADFINCQKKEIYNEQDQKYYINYYIKANKDTNLYLFSDNNLQLIIDGKEQFKDYANIWSTEAGIKSIHHINKDENFEFEISTKSDLESIYIYASDNDKIQEILNKKQDRNKFENVEILSNGLNGVANFDDDGYLVFNISYDDGWKIYIDGNEVEKEDISDAFLGVKVDKGNHNIHIYYEVPGYKIGLVISILSLTFTFIIIRLEKNITFSNIL